MRYVKRNGGGRILDHFAVWEPGCDKEALANDNPELVAHIDSREGLFVERDLEGNIVGQFAVPQGAAREWLPRSHSDILALARKQAADLEQTRANAPEKIIETLMARIAALEKAVGR